jgi:hypothetical protein
MRAYIIKIIQIVYLVVTMSCAGVGIARHESFDMSAWTCGFIGAGIGLILVTLFILVGAVLVSIVCTYKPFRRER